MQISQNYLKYLYAFLVLVFLLARGVSGAIDPAFRRISTIEGLSQNAINVIFQDSRGFIWFGTNDGLNRYDGYEVKIYRKNPFQDKGIPTNLIFDIVEDGDGNLWMASTDKGVVFFNVEEDRFYTVIAEETGSAQLPSGRVASLLIDSDGLLWAGTSDGFYILNIKGIVDECVLVNIKSYQSFEGVSDEDLRSPMIGVLEVSPGKVVVWGNNGLFLCYKDESGELIEKIIPHTDAPFVSLTHIDIYRESLWMSSVAGFYSLMQNPKDSIYITGQQLRSSAVHELLIDSKGSVWIGSVDGLTQYSIQDDNNILSLKEEKKFGADQIGRPQIIYLYEDDEGILWIGLNGGGALCYVPQRKKFRHYYNTGNKGSISVDKIRTIFEDDQNNLWIGTEGDGIHILPNTQSKNYTSGFSAFSIQAGEEQEDHIFYIGNSLNREKVYSGVGYPLRLAELEYKNNKIEIFQPSYAANINQVFQVYADKNRYVWLCSYDDGLFRIHHDEQGKPVKVDNFRAKDSDPMSLSSNVVRSILEDEKGNIWIGTDNGLNKLLAARKYLPNPEFIVYQTVPGNTQSISYNYIIPLIQLSSGEVWVGTMGGGINRVIPGKNGDDDTFLKISMEEGLPNNSIKAFVEDEFKNVWVSSNRGLSRITPSPLNIVNYDINDGLQDYEFGELAACKRSDGEILFGGVNGLNAFYPEDIKSDNTSPRMVFTDFKVLNNSLIVGQEFNGRVILNKSLNATEKIHLKYNENSFAFHFAALHFAAPEKNKYRYKLIGMDQSWSTTSSKNRIANYTFVPPGEYLFIVEGTNLDGVWCNKASRVKIIIEPPWWRTLIAYFAYAAFSILLLVSLTKYSYSRIRRRNELNMERFEKKKIKELSQMKLQFYTNISHEFRTPLTLILGPLEKLISKNAESTEIERQESYGVIYRNTTILLRLINQLMDFRKVEQGKMTLVASESDILDFLREVYTSFQELANRRNVKFDILLPDHSVPLWFDYDKLEKIVYNLLSNAFKYSPEGSAISLELRESEEFVSIIVKDNGLGVSPEVQKHIFERFYQSKRIKRAGSTGVGLSLTKGLVELHHGKIDFESIENKGSTFFVELPKGDKHLTEDEKAVEGTVKSDNYLPVETWPDIEGFVAKEAQKKPVRDQSNSTKILIVEDNDELRKYLSDEFGRNYTVSDATDGLAAIEVCQEMQPDMVISDVMMPRMDGYELCKRLKSDEKTSHIPIILLTAKSSPEYQLKGFSSGADAYVAKPFHFNVLEARVAAIISSREKMRRLYRESVDIKYAEVTMTSMDEQFFQKIVNIVEEHIADPEFTVEKLTDMYGITQNLFNKKLRALTGLTAKAFIRSIRMKRAAKLLKLGRYTVADVTYDVGFNDLKYFRQCFKAEFGLTPSDYYKQYKSQQAGLSDQENKEQ